MKQRIIFDLIILAICASAYYFADINEPEIVGIGRGDWAGALKLLVGFILMALAFINVGFVVDHFVKGEEAKKVLLVLLGIGLVFITMSILAY